MSALYRMLALAGLLLAASCAQHADTAAAGRARPNVVLIVADDLGYSDLGAFGGEIATPNLDALAMAGLRLSDFHVAPSCSPTRSMLLSGTDNHTAGVGAMAEIPQAMLDHSRWGYEGVLTPRVATLAERLHASGYYTLMAGKWHLGMTAAENPQARGFDSSFALLQGAHNHFGQGGFGAPGGSAFSGATYTRDGAAATIPADFYSSDYFASQLIEQIEAAPSDRPFFAYLAFTAPHAPLQAPADAIAEQRGRYDAGWDVVRAQRLERMRALGLIDASTLPHPLVPDENAWSALTPERRRFESRKMEIYAAMVHRLDQNVGRVVEYLRGAGRYDNTIFVFLSDNGAAGETSRTYTLLPGVPERIAAADNSTDNLGAANSFEFYTPYWAQASSAPYRLYKGFMTEGGTRAPAFITYPGLNRQHAIGRAYSDVMDILPTLIEATDSDAGAVVNGREVAAIRGRSMLPYLLARSERVHPEDQPISLELHGQRSVRQGEWKLLSLAQMGGPPGSWALYNLAEDPAEMHDVGDQYPERRQAMIAAWNAYATETQIPHTPLDLP